MNIVKATCEMCHPFCGLNVHVEDGRILKVEPMTEHPFHNNCVKARAIPELVYSPERLTNPLKKVDGEFKEVTWDEAFDFVAQRLTDIRDRYGAKSIVMHTGRAYVGSITSQILRRFADVLGTPNFTSGGSFCHLARTIGFSLTVGDHVCSNFDSSTRCAVLWGDNPTESNPVQANSVKAAQAAGSKLIVIDPRVIPLAKGADIHARIRPGTDCALALSMLNVIIKEGLFDREFVEQWTVGFDKLAEHVEEYPPEKAEEITWVPSDMIRDMARMYATNKPASISLGISMDHSANGIQAIRAITSLMAVTGNISVPGGNILLPPRMPFPKLRVEEKVDEDVPIGIDYPLFTRFGRQEQQATPLLDILLAEKPYPIKALLNFGGNLALTWPDANKIKKAFEKLDLLVDCDIFPTDTAMMADVVLPGATFMEKEDLRDYRNLGLPLFLMQNKATEPVGNSMEDWKIVAGIARRMGYGDYFPWESTEELFGYLLEPSGLTLDELKQKHEGIYYGEKVSRRYLEEGFDTPSKKVELYSSLLEEHGYDPLPTYHEPPESPVSTPALAREYPLILVTGVRVLPYQHSQYHTLPSMRKMVPEPYVEIHPQTAASLGINHGDMTTVETPKGSIRLKANLTSDILPDVVAVLHGWSEANANFLTSMDKENCDPVSGYPGLRQILCRVAKC